MTAKDFSCNFVFVASCVHGYTKVLGKRTTACWCKQAIYRSTWYDNIVNRRLLYKIVPGQLTTTCGRLCKDIVIVRPANRDWACQTERCHTLSNNTSLH